MPEKQAINPQLTGGQEGLDILGRASSKEAVKPPFSEVELKINKRWEKKSKEDSRKTPKKTQML